MKRYIVLLLLVAAAFQAYKHHKLAVQEDAMAEQITDTPQPHGFPAVRDPVPTVDQPAVGTYRCDGRTRCTQMTSCAEATYFLKNCPGVKMDGDKVDIIYIVHIYD